MTVNFHLVLLLAVWTLMSPTSGQAIDGCPMYGCRPSGTFSFSLDVPRANVTISWVNEFFLGPVPNALGCVGNSLTLVCQSNGPGPGDTGLMGLDPATGQVRWRDFVLRFPTLPILDDKGNLWGSDGANLMHYDVNGKPLAPNIPLDPLMRPLFGLQFVSPNLLLLVSETGHISTFLPDGTPMASLVLRGNVQRANGTFLPVAPAVVNENRFYVLTEFKPDDRQSDSNLGIQRLYAIDTIDSVSERIRIAWYANFEKEQPGDNGPSLRFRQKFSYRRFVRKLRDTSVQKPSLLWDNSHKMLYVSLPPPMLSTKLSYLRFKRRVPANDMDYLLGIKDMGNDSAIVFKTSHSAYNMVLYESNMVSTNAGPQLWISLRDNKLLAVEPTGVISKVIDVSKILKTNFTITSKISTARAKEIEEDILIFGIQVTNPTDEFKRLVQLQGIDTSQDTPTCYLIGVDTPENGQDVLQPESMVWMIPTPDDTVVQGQIIGLKSGDSGGNDQLIAFSQSEGKFAKIFSVAQSNVTKAITLHI